MSVRPLQWTSYGQHEVEVASAFYQAGTLVPGAVRPRRHDHLLPVEGDGDGVSGEPQSTDGLGNSALGRSADEEASVLAIHAPDEEVREVRSRMAPLTPTQEEVGLHRIRHLPYRC